MEHPIDIKKIPLPVRRILERLDEQGFETWLVGGCVRDLCLDLTPKDYDLATSALPGQVQELFPHHFATGLEHGTITVVWDHIAVEVTTFRSDGSYSDSRRPDLVIFHDQIDADLSRRDFTMNSMAFRPDRGLLDLHGGLDDLRQGILRTVGDAESRFQEDALRMLRAVRFAVTYNLKPEKSLVHAASRLAERLDRLSHERVSAELMRILNSPYPVHLNDFSGCGLMAAAVELLLKIRQDDRTICERLSRRIHPDLYPEQRLGILFLAASASRLDHSGVRDALRAVFRSTADYQLQRLFMQESRVSRHIAQRTEAILYLSYLRLLMPLDRRLSAVDQRRLLRLLARRSHLSGIEWYPLAQQAAQLLQHCLNPNTEGGPADSLCFSFDLALGQPLTLADLAMDGRLLQLAGWKSGPPLRLLLEKLLSRVIVEPEMNRPADLLALAYDWSAAKVKMKPHELEKNLSCLSGMDL